MKKLMLVVEIEYNDTEITESEAIGAMNLLVKVAARSYSHVLEGCAEEEAFRAIQVTGDFTKKV